MVLRHVILFYVSGFAKTVRRLASGPMSAFLVGAMSRNCCQDYKILEKVPSDFNFGDHVDILFAGAYTKSHAWVGFGSLPPLIEYDLERPGSKDLAGRSGTSRVSTAIPP